MAKSPAYPRQVGRYLIYDPIASGGMATVHFGALVGEGGFSRTVAIKRLRADRKSAALVASLLDEARLVSRVQHPNVVPTLDVVTTDDGEVLVILEYVAGESLSRLLRLLDETEAGIPLRFVTTAMAGVLHGLHAAHDAKSVRGNPLGIVHRDVSPQNILVGVDGLARVLDFGIAKATERLSQSVAGQVKGKLGYIAPEQLQGNVDRRTDIYAAAVVLWEMLTRRRLFWGRDNGEVIDKVLAMEVRAPSELAAGVPAELDALVLRNLSRHPADRQETAREFALALEDMAVATASQLGSWVQEIASEALSRRAEIVAELERDASGHSDNTRLREARTPSDDGEGEAQSGTDVVPTIASLPDVRADEGITAAAESPRGERRGLWLGGALLGLLAAIVLVWIGRSPGVPPELATSASPPAPSASAPVPSAPSSSATEAASEPTAAVPDAGASASVPPATAAPSFAWPPVVSSRPSPPLPSAKQVTDPCDPPFTVDDRGIRRLKPQCM